MNKLIKAEIFKLKKRNMTWVLMYVLIAAIFLIMLLLQAVLKTDSSAAVIAGKVSLLKEMLPIALSLVSLLGTILAVILIASSVGSEYSWQTIRPYLMSTESRAKMLTAKLVAAGIFIIAGMLIAVVCTVLLGFLFTAIRGYSWDLSFFTMGFFWDQCLTFLRTLFVMLPFTLLAFLFTVSARSMAAGIGFGLGVFFVEPVFSGIMGMLPGKLAKIPDYLFSNNMSSIKLLAESSIKISVGQTSIFPSPLHAFIVLAIYCVVFVAIAFAIFRNRDVTG